MAQFICPRCDYSTHTKQSFVGHINRKHTCPSTKSNVSLDELRTVYSMMVRDIRCGICSKAFKHRSSFSRHKAMCTSNTNVSPIAANILTTVLEEIQELKNMQFNQLAAISPPTCITQNINQSITYNITSFGSEDTKHILAASEFLTRCFMEKNLVEIIEKIHFDDKYPQNQNVRLKSLKHGMMETYVNGKWIVTDKDETLDQLVDKGATILKVHTRRNKDTIIDECEEEGVDFDDLKEFIDFVQNDDDFKKPVKKKMDVLFINDPLISLPEDDFN